VTFAFRTFRAKSDTHEGGETPVTTETPSSSSVERYRAVQQSEDFQRLRKQLRSFIFPMTVAFFLWYLLYVLLSAYARGFMSAKIVGNINVALVFGLLQFLSTFVIAWYYSRYAAQKLDPVADEIRATLDRQSADAGTTVTETAAPAAVPPAPAPAEKAATPAPAEKQAPEAKGGSDA
jgi:uncharacterized membrane protein (DUF485 family)